MKKRFEEILLFVCLNILLIFGAGCSNNKKKVLFFGDSITYLGKEPNGYISLINNFIKESGLQNKIQTVDAGQYGNKITDLYLRYPEDVLQRSPQVVVLYIGINDIWLRNKGNGNGTSDDTFGKFYKALVARLRNEGCKVIICTPSVIGENVDTNIHYNKDLNSYADWFRAYAKSNEMPLVDLRKAFVDYEKLYNKENKGRGLLTTDSIHLSDAGNKLVAEKMWEVIKNE